MEGPASPLLSVPNKNCPSASLEEVLEDLRSGYHFSFKKQCKELSHFITEESLIPNDELYY